MADESYCNPVFSIVCASSYDRVIQHAERLEARFQELISINPEVELLSEHYHKVTAQIEMDKLSAVISSPVSHHSRLNNHFNQQRQQLITYYTERLADIGNRKSYVDHNKDVGLNKDVNWKALNLMMEWYDKHKDHPYPTNQDIGHISILGNIAVNDIDTWFHFERIRRSIANK
ncbi:uncharacterized protein LOC143046808 [Mytilus galloprovincialis]|uniref:uncharacterized protein LOC143046808 n=1 Tax=Mytilus galloprovincialis TaxID=29158 RepID=UPI003F7B7662